VIALGAPALAVPEEDRECVADLLADLLVASIERGQENAVVHAAV
jgi:hypothetical protein